MKEEQKTRYLIHSNTGESFIQEDLFEIKSNSFEERRLSVNSNMANIKYREVILNNAVVVVRSDTIQTPLHMDVNYKHPFIKLHFELAGDSNYKPNDSKSIAVSVNKGEYNLFYLPTVNGTLSYFKPRRKSLEIMISQDFLKKAFKANFYTISSSFGRALKNKTPYKLFENSPPIPPSLMFIVNDILNCSYRKEIKEIYLESKIKEIFSYLFAELNKKESIQNKRILSDRESNLVFQSEKLLREYLDKTLTIKQLATLIGTNDYKLKRNFKIITGKPIISYLSDMRMEKARNMLISEDKKVSEVAYAVGYKNPQHFTVAFKKKFGVLPSELMR